MRRKWLNVFLVLALLSGVSLIAYPAVSAWYYERHQSEVCAGYRTEIENMGDSQKEELLQQAEEYNRQLASGTSVTLDYTSMLNLNGDGMMGYIEIPKIAVSLPVYHGVSEDSLKRGAGHLPTTSLPIGGSGTHAVISAHSGMASAKMFTDLEKLERGDCFYLYILGSRLTYEVDRILTVLPTQTEYLAIEPGRDEVTLLTCTPYGINTHRLLVRGHRVADALTVEDAEITEETARDAWLETYWPVPLLGVVLAAAFAALLTYHRRRRKPK